MPEGVHPKLFWQQDSTPDPSPEDGGESVTTESKAKAEVNKNAPSPSTKEGSPSKKGISPSSKKAIPSFPEKKIIDQKKKKNEIVFAFFAKTFSCFSRFRKKENENAKSKKTRKRENHENRENVFVPTPGWNYASYWKQELDKR